MSDAVGIKVFRRWFI